MLKKSLCVLVVVAGLAAASLAADTPRPTTDATHSNPLPAKADAKAAHAKAATAPASAATAATDPKGTTDSAPKAAAPAPSAPAAARGPAPDKTAAVSDSDHPAWSSGDYDKVTGDAAPNAFDDGRIKLGVTFFSDYAYYAKTNFGPQFLTQMNQEGPGNDGFNSFDVTRTYLNFYFSPNSAITLRITPNIYRQVDGSSSMAYGQGSAIGSSSNGNLGFRLKYAYVDFNELFKGSAAFGKDKVTFGQTTNPLVDWEEGLYGYRYVSLTPWNYLSLSSTYVGATVHGPIMFNGKEFLDYHLGVFNSTSFHSIETTEKKQFMGRLTWYPLGTSVDRTGFGLTAFDDYGYTNNSPDIRNYPDYRVAAIASYQTKDKGYEIAGEYDLGRNAFSTGNLFSGVGPGDQFGLGPTPNATWYGLAKAILAGDRTRQRGYDFFGHARLGNSPFALFGLFQNFQPNTNVANDPLDFQRVVVGVSYHMNQYLDLAVDSQNLDYTHSQFTFPAAQLAGLSSSLATSNPSGIANAVAGNTRAILFNMQVNF